MAFVLECSSATVLTIMSKARTFFELLSRERTFPFKIELKFDFSTSHEPSFKS